jgi:hypothetical protein
MTFKEPVCFYRNKLHWHFKCTELKWVHLKDMQNLSDLWSSYGVLFMKMTVAQTIKKFPAFYATQRIINVSKTAAHWTLFWATWTQSKSSRHIPFILIVTVPSYTGMDCLKSGGQINMLVSSERHIFWLSAVTLVSDHRAGLVSSCCSISTSLHGFMTQEQ